MFSGGYYEDDMSSFIQRRSGAQRRFDEYYRCYPVTFMSGNEREAVTHGGKVILPPSALEKLTRLHISYPMLFSLHNGKVGATTHAGVLEFIAEEGRVYVPPWMMSVLQLQPGDLLQLKSTDLPSGTFIKLQPQSTEFLEITDPKAVLENVLRNFSALTQGDIFSFNYNDHIYKIAVLEVKPTGSSVIPAISCVETDLEVDFAPPVGYVEPKRAPPPTPAERINTPGNMAKQIGYDADAAAKKSDEDSVASHFASGGGRKLGGKKGKGTGTSTPTAAPETHTEKKFTGGLQPLRLPHGQLFFGFKIVPVNKEDGTEEETTSGFSGEGRSLKKKGKK